MADPAIELISPAGPCPSSATRPPFRWQSAKVRFPPDLRRFPTRGDDTHWLVEVWAFRPGEDSRAVMKRKTLVSETVPIEQTAIRFPSAAPALVTSAGYLWRVSQIDKSAKAIRRSDPSIFYLPDPDLPIPLEQMMCCDDPLLAEDPAAWVTAYGTPEFNHTASGCFDSVGVIGLRGSSLSGDAVTQSLQPNHKIRAGRHYLISMCVQTDVKELDYVRLRIMAHNGPLPTTGVHPTGTANVTKVGDTSRITTKDWTWVVLPPWRAPKDFDNIAVAAISNHSDAATLTANGRVADICIREVDGCDGHFAPFGPGGVLTLDENMLVPGQEPTAELNEMDLGALTDLFGEPFADDGTSNWYQPGDGCSSFGGWIPEDLTEHVPWLEPEVQIPTPEEIADKVNEVIQDLKHPGFKDFAGKIPFAPNACPDWNPARFPLKDRHDVVADPAPPFAGRDIVYVHGFVPSHVIARLEAVNSESLPSGFSANEPDMVSNVTLEWPVDPAPYLVSADGTAGYFRRTAEDEYWADHIQAYLTETVPQRPNRHMVTGYNCSQRLVFAVHAVLSQIAAAMSTGEGVRQSKGIDTTECFGKEYVIISHSTGALVTNIAMSIAAQTGTDLELQAVLGDLSAIASQAQVHVSLHGATAGSDAAHVAIAGAAILGGLGAVGDIATNAAIVGATMLVAGLVSNPVSTAAANALYTTLTTVDDLVFDMIATVPEVVFNSVLVDLSPLVTKTLWFVPLQLSKVPTLTVVGGHPSFGGMQGLPYALKLLLHGLDDGVVNANSQAGSFNPLHPDTYLAIPPVTRLMDMGLPLVRSASYFVEQHRGIMAAYGASPWLSPSGMVQPVAMVTPQLRYPNHFPFLQGASEHSYTTDVVDEDYVASFGAANYEESLVCDSVAPFSLGLVNPTIISFMRRFERRLDMTMCLKVPIPQITLFPPTFDIVTTEICVTFPVWRRVYDLLVAGASTDDLTAIGLTQTTSISATTTSTPGIGAGVDISIASSVPQPDAITTGLSGADGPLGEHDYVYRFVLPV